MQAAAAAAPPAGAGDEKSDQGGDSKLDRNKSSLTLSTDKQDGADEEELPDEPDITSDAFSEVSGVQTAASVWLPSSQAAPHSNKAGAASYPSSCSRPVRI